jgi:starvation-inducible DNA-binding protein
MGAPMMDTGVSAKDREAIAGEPTLDLLTQRLDIHEKNAWMLRSLLKK